MNVKLTGGANPSSGTSPMRRANSASSSSCVSDEEVRRLEQRLRNPWRDSQGREGHLEAWG